MGNLLTNKLEQVVRLTYLNTITSTKNTVVLVEYPKSGGTWLGQLVSEYLQIPFPRNEFPVMRKSLMHGHYLPSHIGKNNKIIYLVRDGRDVLISFYHHQLVWNDKNQKEAHNVNYHRKEVGFADYENVQRNILAYMKYSYEHKLSKFRRFVFPGNWQEFNNTWLEEANSNTNIYMVRYEDLLEDTALTLEKLLTNFFNITDVDKDRLDAVVNKFSFENQTKRKQGEESTKSFLRKGIRGDWKNYFQEEEKAAFKKYVGSLLVRLGYEKNNDW